MIGMIGMSRLNNLRKSVCPVEFPTARDYSSGAKPVRLCPRPPRFAWLAGELAVAGGSADGYE